MRNKKLFDGLPIFLKEYQNLWTKEKLLTRSINVWKSKTHILGSIVTLHSYHSLNMDLGTEIKSFCFQIGFYNAGRVV